jgi:hypothetical protein
MLNMSGERRFMTQFEILRELKRLPLMEQLHVMEFLAKTLREQLPTSALPAARPEIKKLPLPEAAALLREDYLLDPAVTAFKALESEGFHA